MGMYDEITVEYALPDCPFDLPYTFQTKDFWNDGGRYTITVDGQLIYHEYMYAEAAGSDTLTPAHVGDHVIDHHGYIRFYEHERGHDEWIEYLAKFTDGVLVEVDRVIM